MGIQRTIFFLIFVTCPLFLSTYSGRIPNFSETLRSTFFSVTRPVFSAGETISGNVAGTFSTLRNIFFLYQENERLKKNIDSLQKEVVTLREDGKENERLRSLLDFKRKTPHRTVACRVIARDVTFLSNWAVVDKGSVDGIKKEMPVVNEQGLVGKVVEVGPYTARVILLTDLESRVSGLVQTTRNTGLVMGDGSLFLKMKFIDLESDLKVGDEVISSGLGTAFPKGIPIGKIEFLGREKNGLHLYAKVKPSVSFSKLEEVLCLDYQTAN